MKRHDSKQHIEPQKNVDFMSSLDCTVIGSIVWVGETLDLGLSALPETRNSTEVSRQMAENRDGVSNTTVKGSNNCYSTLSSNDKLWLSNWWHNDDIIWLFHALFYSFVWYLKCLWAIIGMLGTNLRAWTFTWGIENLKESIIIWILFSRSEGKTQFNYLFRQSKYYIKLLVCLWRSQPISHFFMSHG